MTAAMRVLTLIGNGGKGGKGGDAAAYFFFFNFS